MKISPNVDRSCFHHSALIMVSVECDCVNLRLKFKDRMPKLIDAVSKIEMGLIIIKLPLWRNNPMVLVDIDKIRY